MSCGINKLRKFAALPARDIWLLLKSANLLALIRTALWLVPFPATRRLTSWLSRPFRGRQPYPPAVPRLAWAVSVAGRVVPGGSHCLTQALATQVLLSRRGRPSEVCFGIDPSSAQKFAAHAWVEADGMVVIGGPVDGYIRLKSPWISPDGRPLERETDREYLKPPLR